MLFGDYCTALTPEQPRVYEDIQDYDAAKALFEEVGMYLSLVWLFKVCLPCSAPKVTFVVLIGYVYVTLMILPSRSWKSTMRITSQ